MGIGSFLVGASGSLAACGGDDSSTTPEEDSGSDVSTTPSDSGGQSDTSTAGDTSTASAKAEAADITIYLGQIASLDASTSTPAGASFAWAVESAPAGSAVVTSSILNAATAKPTFTPDLAGDYAIKVTVTSGSATDSKTVKVKAVHSSVFYVNNNLQTDAGGQTAELRVVSSGGTDGHSVSCGVPDDAGNSNRTASRVSAGGGDWWEGAPGQESRVAFIMEERLGDAGYEAYLATGTTSSTCAGTKPKKVETAAFTPSDLQVRTGFYFPRFSPDGNRVLYVRNFASPAGTRVATVGFDGTAPHLQIAPYNNYPDGGPQGDTTIANGSGSGGHTDSVVPPRWAPGNKVSWATQFNGRRRWQILVADDADNATPTPMITCTGNIGEYDFLADGTILASATTPGGDAGNTAFDLVVLRPNAVTKECEVVRSLTNFPSNAGSTAQDFTLSPDKRRVAFIMTDNAVIDAGGAGVANNALFTAAVDGSQPPARVPGVPYGAYGRNQGPRWISGGTAISWGQAQSTIDAGDAGGTAVAVVSAGGGTPRAVVAATANDRVFAIGNMCSIGHGGGSALMAFGSLAAFVGLVARRRRRG